MTVPYTFGTATTSIPLSNLDANFNTPITLGNTSIYLGNTTTTIGNLTLTNATISSGTVNITNVTVTTANVTNITVSGTANIATGNITTLTSTSITDSGLTSGRVTFAGASGLLTDNAGFTFDGQYLSIGTGLATLNGLKFLANAGGLSASIGVNNTTGEIQNFATTNYFQTWYTNNTEKMRLTTAGNLGIGVTNPTQTLQLGNATAVEFDSLIAGTRTSTFYTDNSQFIIETATNINMIFKTNATQRMVITGGGNVGIGTSSPSQKLQVEDAGNVTFQLTKTSVASFGISNNGSAGTVLNVESVPMIFNTANTERMRIDSNGNVGIGTSSPSSYGAFGVNKVITVNSLSGVSAGFSDGTTGTLRIAHASGQNIINFDSGNLCFQGGGSGSPTERMRIDSSGNLLVGTTSTGSYADGKITVDTSGTGAAFKTSTVGTAATINWNSATSGDNQFVYFVTETSPTLRGNIAYNRAGGLVAYNVTSDYRAKDIISTTVNSGEVIDSVPVYMGKMKDATQERPMFIAHETPSYAHTGEKDAVDADGKPVYQQMDASTLIPVMWAEIQSLRQRIATLENK